MNDLLKTTCAGLGRRYRGSTPRADSSPPTVGVSRVALCNGLPWCTGRGSWVPPNGRPGQATTQGKDPWTRLVEGTQIAGSIPVTGIRGPIRASGVVASSADGVGWTRVRFAARPLAVRSAAEGNAGSKRGNVWTCGEPCAPQRVRWCVDTAGLRIRIPPAGWPAPRWCSGLSRRYASAERFKSACVRGHPSDNRRTRREPQYRKTRGCAVSWYTCNGSQAVPAEERRRPRFDILASALDGTSDQLVPKRQRASVPIRPHEHVPTWSRARVV